MFPLIASIGDILLARFAGITTDKYMVIAISTAAITIACQETIKCREIFVILSKNIGFNRLFTIFNVIPIPKIPDIIPIGIPMLPKIAPS